MDLHDFRLEISVIQFPCKVSSKQYTKVNILLTKVSLKIKLIQMFLDLSGS